MSEVSQTKAKGGRPKVTSKEAVLEAIRRVRSTSKTALAKELRVSTVSIWREMSKIPQEEIDQTLKEAAEEGLPPKKACKGCFLPIAFGIKKARNKIEEQVVRDFASHMERNDSRGMKLTDYFIQDFEDKKFLLNHSFDPYVVGHLVLQPVDHFAQFHEPSDTFLNKIGLSESDASKLLLTVRKVSKQLEDCLASQNYPPARIYLCSFNEALDWHLHFHIIPRAKQEVVVGPHLLTTARRPVTREEVENVVECLRKAAYALKTQKVQN